MCEESLRGVEHHLWSSDSCPGYRRICALCSSKPNPRCTAVRAKGGGVLTEESEVKAPPPSVAVAAVRLIHQ